MSLRDCRVKDVLFKNIKILELSRDMFYQPYS